MKRLRILSLIILLVAIGSVVYIRVKHGQANDSIAPVISMEKKEIKVSVEDGDDVLLEGITAKDNKDGDVSSTVTIDNISSFNGDGKRYVTVAAFDTSNNVGKATREITYKDYRPPHFDITEPLEFGKGTTTFLKDVTASDILDGDITNGIHFEDNTAIYSDTPGEYEAKIQVKNSAGDLASLPITIKIMDTTYNTKPSVKLKHYVRYTKKNKTVDYRKLIDCVMVGGREYKVVDGDDITNKSIGRDRIHIDDENVNYKKKGNYKVEYKITMEEGEDTVTGKTYLLVVVED